MNQLPHRRSAPDSAQAAPRIQVRGARRGGAPRKPTAPAPRHSSGTSRRTQCPLANPLARRFRRPARRVASARPMPLEGSVVKGNVVAIEKDLAVIDVGLKTEGRVAAEGIHRPRPRQASIKVGDDRRGLSRAHRERAGRSRHLARQGPPRRELGQARRVVRARTRRSTASSSTRSRAASPSTSTAPWPSCRAPRSTSARSATSPR